MKFAYERRNNFEESKRPLDPPLELKKEGEDDDERAEMKILWLGTDEAAEFEKFKLDSSI